PAAGDALDQLGDAIEAVAERGKQRQPLVGERQSARQPAGQLRAQPLLQPLHLVADRRLGYAQLDRGAGEAEVARRRLEGAQGIEGKVGADHRRRSISSANAIGQPDLGWPFRAGLARLRLSLAVPFVGA
ncbi:hypothetical protein QU38_00290, partial [Staphylococcus aureus]